MSINKLAKNIKSVTEIENCDTYFLDIYGLLWDGEKFYDGTLDFLKQLKASGKKIVLLSNATVLKEDFIRSQSKKGLKEGEHFDDAGASADDELDEDNDTISVTLSNIQLVPGSDFPEIIKFVAEDADTSDSSPFTVDTRIKVKAVVNTTSTDEFHYENTTFIPITSKVKVNSTEASIYAGAKSDCSVNSSSALF